MPGGRVTGVAPYGGSRIYRSKRVRKVGLQSENHDERKRQVVEILRTNDLVLISLIEAILQEEGIGFFVADRHMSAVEGSLGFLPRRILVDSDDVTGARRALINAGLGNELQGVESRNG